MPAPRISTQPSPLQTRHGRPVAGAVEARHVDLDRGLGEGEEVRPQAHLAVGAEHLAGERQQRALEMRQGEPAVDGQALDLGEHRRVGGIGRVAPVAAAGRGHVDGRWLGLHRPDLHRRRVRAKHRRSSRRRRCRSTAATGAWPRCSGRRRCSARCLDLRAVDDAVAEADEYLEDVARRLLDQVGVPAVHADAGQRDVDPVARAAAARAPRRAARGARCSSARLQRPPGVVQHLPPRTSLVGGQRSPARAAPASAAPAGPTPPPAPPPAPRCRRRGDACEAVPGEGVDVHERPSLLSVLEPPSAYDELGSAYDAWCRSVTEDIAFYVDLALRSGGPVLEIGVGSGRVAVPTALAGVEVVGVDTSPAMLDLARRQGGRPRPSTLDLRLGRHARPARPGPVPPGHGAVPRVPAPARRRRAAGRAARRCARRLRPGGTLAFDVFHPDRQDISETHGRWIEREPGIFEQAAWDAPEQRSLS